MTSEDVARYLKDHPEFFEEYADLLGSIYIPHPHGGRAIPLAERQMLTLRERSRVLEGKLRELVQFGEENDSISERLHRITLGLLAARNTGEVLDSLYTALRRDFAIGSVAVRLWNCGPAGEREEFSEVSAEARVFAESLTAPYFSAQPMFESAAWLPQEQEGSTSLVYLPLRGEQPIGVLLMGSADHDRFAPDKGTLYLNRLADVVSTALRRCCEG